MTKHLTVYGSEARASGLFRGTEDNDMNPNRSRKKNERPVLVTTAHRGVFFGYATDTSGDTIKLRRARNCIMWRGLRGFLALASEGPNDKCRIGPAADFEVRHVTGVAECTPEAVKAWENAPWSR